MTTLELGIDLDVPAATAYKTWTRFDLFPSFMEGVVEVSRTGDRQLHWRANVWGKNEEWDAEITERVPGERIAWRSKGGATNSGEVRFEPLSKRASRVNVRLAYEPERLSEKLGDALGIVRRQVAHDLGRFKTFAELWGEQLDRGVAGYGLRKD